MMLPSMPCSRKLKVVMVTGLDISLLPSWAAGRSGVCTVDDEHFTERCLDFESAVTQR